MLPFQSIILRVQKKNMENILVNNKKYEGQFVAFSSFSDKTIIATGTTAEETLHKAEKQGKKDPVIMYIPENDITCIF